MISLTYISLPLSVGVFFFPSICEKDLMIRRTTAAGLDTRGVTCSFSSQMLILPGFRRGVCVRGEGILLHENKIIFCQLTAHFFPSLKAILLTFAENNPFNYII